MVLLPIIVPMNSAPASTRFQRTRFHDVITIPTAKRDYFSYIEEAHHFSLSPIFFFPFQVQKLRAIIHASKLNPLFQFSKKKNINHLGGGPVVRAWNQEVCFLCGLRFEPCGSSYDDHWRLTWSLTSGPVGLVEVRASWLGHPR